ncbi:MAG TPA: Clp protease N-terminal domain-containing protein, partial [Burkholderiales bacterium]
IHLMAALLDQEGGTTRPLLAQCDVNINALRSKLSQALDRLPTVSGAEGEVHVSNDLGKRHLKFRRHFIHAHEPSPLFAGEEPLNKSVIPAKAGIQDLKTSAV